ncbi:MAG: TldD/PmbA family protein, partial [Vicinamibacteria bacterium]|nr:TldD/PmbA family protein [Vicinamibacteria bacterium]
AGDAHTVSVRLHSNGFAGRHSETSFHLSAEVSLQDDDGRRPEEYAFATAHHQEDLPAAPTIGAEALRRAQARLGAVQGPSARLTMVVENRVAGGLLAALLGPLSAQALQQKRSFLDGRQGQRIGSALLTVHDDPLIVRGLGSRRYDSEGLAARRLALFDEGRLANYFVDTYYGKKLGLGPTTAGASNIVWVLGAQDRDTLIRDVQDGILVTGFLGGNSNAVTGDFSFGIQGARIRAGQLTEPVNEMNLAGNQLDLWPRLAAVGNDPYPYSASATPTLCFEMAQFAGG